MTPDWVTVRGSSAVTTIVQAPETWLDVSRYADATFHLELAEVTTPGVVAPGLVLIQLETSPTPDESLFTVVAGPVVATPSATPLLMRTTGAGSVPLAKYVRWKVIATANTSWDVTFRIRASCNRQSYFAPTQLGGCAFWVRADRALSFVSANVSGWADQSGRNDPNKNLTAAAGTDLTPTIADSNYNNQQTLAFTGSPTSYLTSGIWATSLPTPCTWVLVGHRSSSANTNYFVDGNGGAVSLQSMFGTPPALGVAINLNAGAALTFANAWTTPSATLFEVNGATSKIFNNNFTTASASGNAGSNTLTSLSVGSQNVAGGPGNTWSGTMAEIICFSKILTATQKGVLRTYLNNRYALSIG